MGTDDLKNMFKAAKAQRGGGASLVSSCCRHDPFVSLSWQLWLQYVLKYAGSFTSAVKGATEAAESSKGSQWATSCLG